jgi:hypothetical protein
MHPTKYRFIWQSGFRGEALEINQSETRIVCDSQPCLLNVPKHWVKQRVEGSSIRYCEVAEFFFRLSYLDSSDVADCVAFAILPDKRNEINTILKLHTNIRQG